MIPLVENNFNLCELGPRSTGKSHLFKEISPNSILVSGGQTTVANLFYNMGRKTVGLVGLWDCVAFDEVAGIHFKDKDGIQIMNPNDAVRKYPDAVFIIISMLYADEMMNQLVLLGVPATHISFFDIHHSGIGD